MKSLAADLFVMFSDEIPTRFCVGDDHQFSEQPHRSYKALEPREANHPSRNGASARAVRGVTWEPLGSR